MNKIKMLNIYKMASWIQGDIVLSYSHKGEIPRKGQRKTEQPDFGKKQRKERVSTDGLEET